MSSSLNEIKKVKKSKIEMVIFSSSTVCCIGAHETILNRFILLFTGNKI